jgi:hypothetical protein
LVNRPPICLIISRNSRTWTDPLASIEVVEHLYLDEGGCTACFCAQAPLQQGEEAQGEEAPAVPAHGAHPGVNLVRDRGEVLDPELG